MKGRVTRAQTRRSRATPSQPAKRLDATPVPAKRLDATPVPAKRLDATPVPAKRARLTRTGVRQSGVDTAEQTDKATQQPTPNDEATQTTQPTPNDEATQTTQSTPNPLKRRSFLKGLVDVRLHPRLESRHAFVSDWLESVGSERERCRSDSHPSRPDDDPAPRQLMGHTQDDGLAALPSSSSVRLRSDEAGPGGDSSPSPPSSASVRKAQYRQINLKVNHIHILDATSPLPDIVSGYASSIRAPRDSPGLSPDELNQAMHEVDFLARGCDEGDVTDFLTDTVFPNPRTDTTFRRATGLMSNANRLIARHLVPADHASPHRVTQPKPDRLYGYSEWPTGGAFTQPTGGAFTQPQLLAQTMLHPWNPDYPTATSRGLRFPFLAVEFKAAGGTGGNLWVATNQCAGAVAACLNAVDRLNASLRAQSERRVDNVSYCIAVDNKVAELYISWKEGDLDCYLQQIDTFLLLRPEEFKNFRNQVRNILDWGKGARLTQIREALDIILEGNRRRASEAAKSRPPPSGGAAVSAKQHRSSARSGAAYGQ